MKRTLLVWLILLNLTLPALAQGGGSLTLPISLARGLGLPPLTGAVVTTFEDVSGLSAGNLGVSTQLVSLLDALLSGRLAAGLSLLTSFPVLLRIEPPPAGGLAFHGIYTIEVDTGDLPLVAGALRLFKAPLNGTFQDVTTSVTSVPGPSGRSSYRVQGTSGGFSEFILVLDLTPVTQAINGKLDRLDQVLAANASSMPAALHDDLAAQLATVRGHSAPGSEEAALQDLDAFLSTVQAHSGTDIPDLWRSARDLVDVAGELRAAAATLQLSLRQRQGP